jgi:hypothetical protein
MTARQIFGRDPMLIVSAHSALVALAGSTVFNLTGDQIGSIGAAMAALAIIYTSWGTYDKVTSALIQLTKVVIVLAVTFGAHITADQTALVIVAVETIAGAFGRTQVTAIDPGPAKPAVPGSVPVTEVG